MCVCYSPKADLNTVGSGRAVIALPEYGSDFDLFGNCKRGIDLDAEISHCALDFGVAEQELHRPQVSGAAVNQSRFGAP
jgi:hypothetical protein